MIKRSTVGLSDAALQRIAVFAAFSMFCAALEYLFPRPVPFFRLGLANLPIILALPLLNFRQLMLLTLMKVLGQGIVNGTLASYVFLFSLAGSFGSFFLMYALHRFLKLSYVGISLAGALASNTLQSLFSVVFIFGQQAWVILPLFYGLGFAAGLVIGFLAEHISRNSCWFDRQYVRAGLRPEPLFPLPIPVDQIENSPTIVRKTPLLQKHLSTPAACIAGVISLPLFLIVDDPLPRLLQVIILGILVRAAGKRLLISYFVFLIFTVTFFHLLIPQGRVLLSIAQLSITEGALFAGLYRGLSIIGLVFISLFSIRRDLQLPGTIGRLIGVTLRYFEQIYEYRKSARLNHLVKYLDKVLFDIEQLPFKLSTEAATRISVKDVVIITAIATLLLLPLVVQPSLSFLGV